MVAAPAGLSTGAAEVRSRRIEKAFRNELALLAFAWIIKRQTMQRQFPKPSNRFEVRLNPPET